MFTPPSSPPPLYRGTTLLRDAIEVLRWELSALTERRWEELPELKKKKVLLASRLRQVDWTSIPFGQELAEWARLKSELADLEQESRRRIEGHLNFVGNQLLALQEQHQYWRECLSVSFRKFYESVPS